MLVFDFFTAGSPSAAFAVAAAGAAGVAATDFAGATGGTGAAGAAVVAAAGAVFGATVVCADATKPAVASSAKIRVFFNIGVLQKHGDKATFI